MNDLIEYFSESEIGIEDAVNDILDLADLDQLIELLTLKIECLKEERSEIVHHECSHYEKKEGL